MRCLNLKVICVIMLFAVYATAQEVTISPTLIKQARKIQKYCQKETGVAEELIVQSRKNVFSNDRDLQCFLRCCLDIGGLMNSNNEIHMEPLQQILLEEWYLELIRIEKICGTKAGSDACEIAYNTIICYAENSKKYPMLL